MTEAAGEVADGFMVHPFCTERSLHEVTLPALERGRARAGARRGTDRDLAAVMIATGDDDAAMEAAIGAVRAQIAFYALDPRVPGRARRPRLGRPPAAAARPHPIGGLGRHGERRPRRPAPRRRRRGRHRTRWPARSGAATAPCSTASPSTPRTPPTRTSGSRSPPTSAVSRPRRRRRRGRRPPRRRRRQVPASRSDRERDGHGRRQRHPDGRARDVLAARDRLRLPGGAFPPPRVPPFAALPSVDRHARAADGRLIGAEVQDDRRARVRARRSPRPSPGHRPGRARVVTTRRRCMRMRARAAARATPRGHLTDGSRRGR